MSRRPVRFLAHWKSASRYLPEPHTPVLAYLPHSKERCMVLKYDPDLRVWYGAAIKGNRLVISYTTSEISFWTRLPARILGALKTLDDDDEGI